MKFYGLVLYAFLIMANANQSEKKISENVLKPVRKAQKFMIQQIRLHERSYVDNYSLYLAVKNYLDELINLENQFLIGDEFFQGRKIEKYLERIKRSIISRENGYGVNRDTKTLFMKYWIIYIDNIRHIQDNPTEVIQRVRHP